MGPITKMLRTHQMRDDRWTVRDKVTQYRGLTNLFIRDRKQTIEKNQKLVDKNYKEIRQLTNDTKYYQTRLENACSDKQRVRNALANHQLFLKAYEHLYPKDIVHNIDHKNFVKMKTINKLNCKLAAKEKKLHKLQIEVVALQDEIDYQATIVAHRSEQIIVNKINNMSIRHNTAGTVKFNYQRILAILKKDSIYFDTVLNSLRYDQQAQCKCIFRATELGQLATEDLDSLRREYKVLEKEVKADMRMRDKQVKRMRDDVNNLFSVCKLLTRTESDAVIDVFAQFSPDSDELKLPKDLESIKEILRQLQEVTMVPDFEAIFPRMEMQISEKIRISKQLSGVGQKRESLQSQYEHAKVKLAELEHTEEDSNKEFDAAHNSLQEKILETDKKQHQIDDEIEDVGELFLTIRFSLQTLRQILDRVRDPTDPDSDDEDDINPTDSDELVILPEGTEDNAEGLLNEVLEKLKTLTAHLIYPLNETQAEKAKLAFEQQVVENQVINAEQKEAEADIPLVEEAQIEDSLVLTRDGVKSRSDKIVEWFERPLELQMTPQMGLKSKAKSNLGMKK